MHIHEERARIKGACQCTIFRVFSLSDAAIWSSSLIVVLGQGQGSDARTRRRLAARSLGFLQATVIVAVLRGILQVLHGVGGGKGHSPMGMLKNREKTNEFVQCKDTFFPPTHTTLFLLVHDSHLWFHADFHSSKLTPFGSAL